MLYVELCISCSRLWQILTVLVLSQVVAVGVHGLEPWTISVFVGCMIPASRGGGWQRSPISGLADTFATGFWSRSHDALASKEHEYCFSPLVYTFTVFWASLVHFSVSPKK